MIKGLTFLNAKCMSTPALTEALRKSDTATAQAIVNDLLNSPEFLFDEYVKDNLLDQVIASAPLCTAESIRRGLRAAIADVPVNPRMLRAILPYAELTTRNYALLFSCKRNCEVAIDILYPLCDIPYVVGMLNHPAWRSDIWRNTLQQRMDDEKLRETLIAQLPSVNQTSQRKI
jgi:hypothetical protein